MNECRECGVIVEDGLDACPLCGAPVTDEARERAASIEPGDVLLKPPASLDPEVRETVRGAKIWLFEMVTIVAFTAGMILFATDIASGFQLTWSLTPLAAIGFVYLFTVAIILFIRRPVILLASEALNVALLLLALDVLVGQERWILALGLPITVLVAVLTGVSVAAIVKLRLNALQAVAVVFLAAGICVVGIEFVINRAQGELLVSWSLIAFACTLSVFAVLMFINRRLREHHSEFRKIFHL
jgi:hypothetical protein